MKDVVAIHHIDTFRAGTAAGTVAGIWGQATDVAEEEAQAFAIGTYPKHVRWPDFRLFVAAIDDHPSGVHFPSRPDGTMPLDGTCLPTTRRRSISSLPSRVAYVLNAYKQLQFRG